MSARLARTTLSLVARRVNASSAGRVARRNMSFESTSHGASAKSSDTPWIAGSALVFGPLFLYLVSPSGRKATQANTVHDDVRDFPAIKLKDQWHHPATPAAAVETEEAAPVEIMKDDEGTPANVASSIALATESDVPKTAESPEASAGVAVAAKSEAEDPAPATVTEEAASSAGESSSDTSGTFQKSGEEGPTDLKTPREAAKKGVTPKEHADA
ncbi:hypothetical protein K443DRAFT_672918 [Laccaria amethystina LaAM-08-1]|uniref:Uncharacterized protein n=1 Tax=Laccaria amethystina LaAM-08-1 TaxID=1095629 RepID=A0A0C9Y2I5_9AGAR|nr:hypothetical protein K443DRAFT_672918 [Laccaria amethystina LaAM-08-1]